MIKVDGFRRRSSPEFFTVPSATGNFKLSPFIGVDTSSALSLLAWSSDASISSNSSMSAISMSRFLPHTIHNRGTYLARLLNQIDVISMCPSQRWGDLRRWLQTVSVRQRAFRIAVHRVSSHQTRDLSCFADSSGIP